MANIGWLGGTSGAYDLDANWAGNDVPGGGDVALFKLSTHRNVLVAASNSVQRWDIGADDYDFTIASNNTMTFAGAGITNGAFDAQVTVNGAATVNFFNSSTAGTIVFVVAGQVNFANSSNAGDSLFHVPKIVEFGDQSSAATASFNLVAGAQLRFTDSSSAGAAGIRGAAGNIIFSGSSTAANAFSNGAVNFSFTDASNAGSALLRTNGTTAFDDNSSAKTASFTAQDMTFSGNSTAADSQIDSEGTVFFTDHATAANARITVHDRIVFGHNADPGKAVIVVLGEADFSPALGPAGDRLLTVGSLEGAGVVKLGGSQLTIGSRNTSTALTGNILGDEPSASIVKVGSGVFSVGGSANTYSGGSTVIEGVLDIDGVVLGAATATGGALGGTGTITGAVLIGGGAILAPGRDAVLSPTDTKGALKVGGLTLGSRASLSVEIGGIAAGVQHDAVIVKGAVAIGEAATLDLVLTDSFTPSITAQQKFLIVENDGIDAISGRFDSLAEGTIFTLNSRLFTISYTGGTGNDVVLTSEGVLITGTATADTVSKGVTPPGQPAVTRLNDKVFGLGGKDKIKASGGDDTVQGGAGKDTIDGGKGSDTADYSDKSKSVAVTLDGSHEVTARIKGKAEDSLKNVENLVGGSKADTFTGDRKANSFDGGLGKDVLKGAGGKDVFVFSIAPGKANADTILDFKHKTDTIALEDSVFGAIGASLDAAEFFARKGATKAHDADDRIIYNKTTGQLFYDADGSDGPAKAMLFATLSNKATLTTADFDIV